MRRSSSTSRYSANAVRAEIDELERQTQEAPHLRAAQRALADDVTDLVHSKADRDAAVAAANALFGRAGPSGAQRANARSCRRGDRRRRSAANEQLPPIVDVLERSGVVPSKAAARRAIAEGGAYLNNVRIQDQEAMLTRADLLHGRFAILRRGKRTVGAVTVTVSDECPRDRREELSGTRMACGCSRSQSVRLHDAEYPGPAVRSTDRRLRMQSGQVGLTGRSSRRKVCEASAGRGTRQIIDL